MIEGKRNSQGGFLPLSPPNFQSEKRKKLGKKSSRQSATLCNHAAQSITRQTVRLSTLPLSLSLLHTQFFKRPSSPIRLLARIGHRQRGPRSNLNLLWQKYIYIYIRNIQPPRFNPSNENRLWTGFVAIPIVSWTPTATFPLLSSFLERGGMRRGFRFREDRLDSMSFDES